MNAWKHRKAEARLRLLNPDGTHAANCPVQADQVSHQFLFGCDAFDTVAMMKTEDERKKTFLRERMEKRALHGNLGTHPQSPPHPTR